MGATVNGDLSTSDGLVQLGEPDLADSHGGGDTHDRRGNEILGGNTETDVSAEHGASDGGEPRGHGQICVIVNLHPPLKDGSKHTKLRVGHHCGMWDQTSFPRSGGVECGVLTVNIRSDQASGLSLANPRRCSCDDSLSTGDTHDLEEEPGARAKC